MFSLFRLRITPYHDNTSRNWKLCFVHHSRIDGAGAAVISNQARFRREQVTLAGKATAWMRTAESGTQERAKQDRDAEQGIASRLCNHSAQIELLAIKAKDKVPNGR
jgi:hypothetical protein